LAFSVITHAYKITIWLIHYLDLFQCFSTFLKGFFNPLPKSHPDIGSLLPSNHACNIFSQKFPFILVAHPIIREQTTNYNH